MRDKPAGPPAARQGPAHAVAGRRRSARPRSLQAPLAPPQTATHARTSSPTKALSMRCILACSEGALWGATDMVFKRAPRRSTRSLGQGKGISRAAWVPGARPRRRRARPPAAARARAARCSHTCTRAAPLRLPACCIRDIWRIASSTHDHPSHPRTQPNPPTHARTRPPAHPPVELLAQVGLHGCIGRHQVTGRGTGHHRRESLQRRGGVRLQKEGGRHAAAVAAGGHGGSAATIEPAWHAEGEENGLKQERVSQLGLGLHMALAPSPRSRSHLCLPTVLGAGERAYGLGLSERAQGGARTHQSCPKEGPVAVFKTA